VLEDFAEVKDKVSLLKPSPVHMFSELMTRLQPA